LGDGLAVINVFSERVGYVPSSVALVLLVNSPEPQEGRGNADTQGGGSNEVDGAAAVIARRSLLEYVVWAESELKAQPLKWLGGRRIDLTALVLYAGSIAWVIGYDTIYAHQDAEDDALIGIKSTARLFAARTRPALTVFYTLAVVLVGIALMLAAARWPAWLGLATFAAHLVWQIKRLDIADPALCLRIFKSNRDAGLLLFAGLLADAVLRVS
jgi:hypothetical protein